MATTVSGSSVSRRRAFSLIELVVVVAILALLAGIVLTGVQSARESARRMLCASNLRQLGLGLAMHHEARGVLPPSWGGPDSTCTLTWGNPPTMKPYPGPGIGAVSGFVFLLPFVGEESLFARIEAANWPGISEDVYTTARIATLLCPSDITPRSHNYLFSIGDRYDGFWPGFTIPPAENRVFQASIRGLFGLQSRVRLQSVRDGLSHTIAMSECVRPRGLGRVVPPGKSEAGISYADGYSEAVANDGFAASMSNADSPAACLASFVGGRFRSGTTLMDMNRSPGSMWSNGRPSFVSCSMVLPPNAPRCNDYLSQGSLTPQSRHPGGVLGLMADGAVRFIGDGIDAGDPSLPDRQRGPSPYGVWGALGSRNGGEVVAVPDS